MRPMKMIFHDLARMSERRNSLIFCFLLSCDFRFYPFPYPWLLYTPIRHLIHYHLHISKENA